MKEAIVRDKKRKLLLKARGLEEFYFKLSDIVKESELEQYVSTIIANASNSGGDGSEDTQTIEDVQHYGTTVSLTSDPQTITYASLGFPSIVNVVMPPIIIPRTSGAPVSPRIYPNA